MIFFLIMKPSRDPAEGRTGSYKNIDTNNSVVFIRLHLFALVFS